MDRASWQWVQADVEESLEQARRDLEAFAQNPDLGPGIEQCAHALHAARGVLEMLEVYGVSLLLDELEALTRAIAGGAISRRDDACAVLMQGIAQVPEYLDHITRGHRDNSIVLMPLLNDVRSVQGKSLLSESVLFSPDLDAPLPLPERPVAAVGEAFRSYVARLRPHYQRGLIAWFRGGEPAAGLEVIEAVIAHLQKLLGTSPAVRLWWVARAVVEALKTGDLAQSISIKLLMGQLDRRLRLLGADGHDAAQQPPPAELLQNLLYYCAQARPGARRLEVIRATFALDDLVVEATHDGVGPPFGPDLNIPGSVSPALKASLARVRETLDTFSRGDRQSAAPLAPLASRLGEIADTLGLLSLGVPRRQVLAQRSAIAAFVAHERLPDDGELLAMAAALISVEGALDKLDIAQPSMHPAHPEAALADGLAPGPGSSTGGLTPDQLTGMAEFAGRALATAAFADSASSDLSVAQGREALSSDPSSDGLRGDDESFLAFAMPQFSDVEAGTPEAPVPAGVAESLQHARALLDRMERNSDALASASEAVPGDIADGVQTAGADAAGLGDSVAADIVDIFLEEGDEAVATLAVQMPQWRADPDHQASLAEIRRAFHTLKGSGRLVGAATIGDLCWSVENLLNRVIDGGTPASTAVTDLVQEACDGLPALFAELRGGPAAGIDVVAMASRAEALAQAGASTVAEQGQVIRVFHDQALNHLAVLAGLLAGGERQPESFIGAVHALKGTARSAGLGGVAGACAVAEDLLSTLAARGTTLDDPAHDFLQQLHDGVRLAVRSYLSDASADLERAEELAQWGRDLAFAVSLAAAGEDTDGTPDPAALAERLELREHFLEEAGALLDQYDSLVERWRGGEPGKQLLDELQRTLHTMKGGARMALLHHIGDLSHSLESVISLALEDRLAPDAALFGVVEVTQDALADMLDRLAAHQRATPATDLIARIEALAAGEPLPARTPLDELEATGGVAVSPGADELQANEPRANEPRAGSGGAGYGVAELPAQGPFVERADRIPVDAALLDNLVDYAGEISISQSRIEQQVGAFRSNLDEMNETVTRLREQLRRLEMETESQILYRDDREADRGRTHEAFDPLEFDRFGRMQELSRGLAESVGDLGSIRDMLDGLTRESETILLQQARTNTDLQHGLMETRMLPFARLVPRFRRVVRQTARELQRPVRFDVTGDDIRIDRAILNRIVGALEHVLRNAVDHGIERAQKRLDAGKSPEGRVALSVARDGPEVVLTVTDDGPGIDLEAVRARAVDRGLLASDLEVSAQDLQRFIFEPAFSTRDTITQISGRGVGLDVVQSDVKQLGGSVRVEHAAGQGTRFSMRLPLTLAINQALMVMAGAEQLGLPLANVDAVVRVDAARARHLEATEAPVYEHAGLRFPFVYLGAALGIAEPLYHQERYPVVLLRVGDQRVALRVDELRGRHEVVVKPVGPLLGAIRWLSGATIMGDGRVVLILDAATLTGLGASSAGRGAAVAATDGDGAGRTVMVVDDSLTVRRVTGRFLQRNGIRVLTAGDGLEALEQLRERLPDLLLLDIEMPRMDGFELATTLRNDPRTRDIPIVMITSRTGQKHTERAVHIGVDHCLGKPYHEGELLETINALLGTGKRRGV